MRWIKRVWGSAASAARRFFGDRRGVSTVEYALIVVAIIAIVGAVAAQMGGAFEALFEDLEEEMIEGVGEVETAGGTGGADAGTAGAATT